MNQTHRVAADGYTLNSKALEVWPNSRSTSTYYTIAYKY